MDIFEQLKKQDSIKRVFFKLLDKGGKVIIPVELDNIAMSLAQEYITKQGNGYKQNFDLIIGDINTSTKNLD